MDAALQAELAYEHHLETRYSMEPEEQADFDRHCEAWPNGYGVCPKSFCSLGVYHPGACEACREASELGWRPGQWKRSFDFFGIVVTAVARKVDHRENELLGVVYASADGGFRVLVVND